MDDGSDPMQNNDEKVDDDSSNFPIDLPLDPTFSTTRSHKHIEDLIDYKKKKNKTPVWGILTEPLKGTLKSDDNVMEGYDEYVPAAHVKFIEQTGAKVIPISYKLTRSSLYSLLEKVNGLYIHGDSSEALTNEHFQSTFSYIISYMYDKADLTNDYFPIFMMGHSFESLLANRVSRDRSMLRTSALYYSKNYKLRLTMKPESTYLFDELTTAQVDENVQGCNFYFRQKVGLTVRDFK